jgi:chaperonin GroEL (HSP60 family)
MANEAPRVLVNSTTKPVNNIVSGQKLKDVQSAVLNDLKEAIINSMGPAGSNSLILRGSSDQDIVAEYSKDGNKIIKSIKYQYPIEMAIKSEIENSTRYIEKTVGDGTSSVVVMSSLIFDALNDAYSNGEFGYDPYDTMRLFKKCVDNISEKIRANKRDCTLDDIYHIAYISTNGNEEVAKQLQQIYKEYGMSVFIDVSASTNENTYVKTYNGITIEAGYSDPAMINNLERNDCRIRSTERYPVHIYQFAEPIDTSEQLALFTQIIETNIMEKRFKLRQPEIPTVILAPQISRDAHAYMRRVVQMLLQFGEAEYSQKPQLLIVTNYAGLDENYVDHISNLCGCKPIKKYIDDKIQKADQESGLAPTLKNVCEFYGTAGEVEADGNITRFIDPAKMYEKDSEGNIKLNDEGYPVYSKTYTNIVNFLESQYKSNAEQGRNVGVLGSLKRQLNAVKANMVELFIGGISISDRDSLRDLVEDAVLNTRSAAKNGVGYGANTMGYCITRDMLETNGFEDQETKAMIGIINEAYTNMIRSLYRTIFAEEEAIDAVINNIYLEGGRPYNMTTREYDGLVLTSIESEPMILDTISKIITIMYTANQAILQAPALTSHY